MFTNDVQSEPELKLLAGTSTKSKYTLLFLLLLLSEFSCVAKLKLSDEVSLVMNQNKQRKKVIFSEDKVESLARSLGYTRHEKGKQETFKWNYRHPDKRGCGGGNKEVQT